MEDHKPPQSPQLSPESKATMDSASTTLESEVAPASSSNNNNNNNNDNTMQIDHRTNRTLLMAILHTLIRPFGPKIVKMTCEYPPGSPQLDVPKHATTRCNVSERKVNDVYIYDMTAKAPHNLPGGSAHPNSMHNKPDEKESAQKHKRIYYFAGGGWRQPASIDHWSFTSKLAASIPNSTVSLISYPLAPNSPAAQSIPILLDLLPTLLHASEATNETTILAGDSAGGNLALALPLEMLRAAAETSQPPPPMPTALLLLSASVDLRRSNPAITQTEPKDPLLRHKFIKATSDVWCGDMNASDSKLSPLLVEDNVLHALRDRGVQVHGVTGGYDILTPDGLLFRDRLVEAGVAGSWLHWEKQMHVFPLAWRYGLRESREAKDWCVEVLRKV
jgi:acetyl esterase/lipase